MLDLIWLIPALPLAGFVLILLFGRLLGEPKSGILAALMVAGSFVVSVAVFFELLSMPTEERHHVLTAFSWVPIGSLHVDLAFLADPLSITMALFVTGIGSLIHLYAIGYMHGDPKFSKFFLYLNLFVFSMLMLVMGENLLVTFLGWEGVGTCSYFLISFWHTRESAATAGKKAFVTNRVGDWGVMMAMFLAFGATGTLSYAGINHAAESGALSTVTATGIAMMLFIGACGKSAQLPLYIWLPDAMEGPTPVSALIHAATMVTAGVFVMTRINPVLAISYDWVPTIIAVVGVVTALFAATIAVAQTDIKKVLAYSTVSQLGYMMMGLGAGAWLPAVFHIFTHAFFKACLFLGAGSISHSSSHHSFEMKKDMGGLRKFMPITFGTWVISTLALCGVFPFSGFFSKDEIIDNVGHNGYSVFMYVGLAGAFLTAAYMTRATYLTFFGQPRGASAGEHHEEESHDSHAAHDDHADHGHDTHDSHDAHASHGPHESGWLITAPLIILATLALSSGFLNALPFGEKFENFKKWVEPSAEVINPTGIAYVVGGVGEARIASDTPTDSTVAPDAEVVTVVEGEAGPEMLRSTTASGEDAHSTEGEASMADASGPVHHESPCGTETPEQGVCAAPQLHHAPFKWSKAGLSMLIVFAGFLLSLFVCIQLYEKKNKKFVGLTERNKVLGFGYKLLVNKYYLDVLYEKIIVRSIAHPIANAVYWFNQKVLDGVVNGAGTTAKGVAGWVYRNIDQRVVDGAVNGTGSVAQGAGSALRPVQSGKVNQYGALLFGAAAIGALVLVIVNT